MPEGETPAAARPSLLSRLSSWRAPAEPQTMEVHAPEGSLGLQFARDSTVLSRIYDTSPLLNKVQVGWTLVSIDGEDVSRMNGWQVTKLLTSRVHDPDGRRLSFTTGETPPVAAGEVLPEFEGEGEQPVDEITTEPAAPAKSPRIATEPAAPAESPRLSFWAAGLAAAAGARQPSARTPPTVAPAVCGAPAGFAARAEDDENRD